MKRDTLISIWDFEFLPNKKFSKEGGYIVEAIQRLKYLRQFHEENYEDVIELPDLLLCCHRIAIEQEKWRKNTNAVKRI